MTRAELLQVHVEEVEGQPVVWGAERLHVVGGRLGTCGHRRGGADPWAHMRASTRRTR